MDAMLFYRSFYEAIQGLKLTDQAKVYNAIFAYALDGEEQELTGISKSIFTLIKPQIDANNKKRLDGAKGAEYGKLGGRPKKNPTGDINKNPDGVLNKNPLGVSESDEAKTPNEKVKVNEKVNEKENIREKATRFSPPSLDDIREYCRERNSSVDPEKFLNHYTSNGWMVGRNKMKDWKAAVRSWESREGFGHNDPPKRENTDKLQALEDKYLKGEAI